MKLREIILDFTSLLDVIMIILFWFIINYRAQAQAQIAQAEQNAAIAIANAEAQSDEAEKLQQEAESLKQQAENELTELAEISKRQASNLQAMLEFGKAENITIYLCMEEDGWKLNVYKGTGKGTGKGELLGVIPDKKEKKIGLELNTMLNEAGYESTDTIFCVFIYNSTEPGTRNAYTAVDRELKNVQFGNGHFYWTEVDSSNQEE